MKTKFNEYSESEFVALLRRIVDHSGSESEVNQLVLHFEKVSEHPDGSDLIFYPASGVDDSPEGILEEIKKWHAANRLPGFKSK